MMSSKNEQLQAVLGTIKVISIQRNSEKRAAFNNYFMPLDFEYIIDLDMTIRYLNYPYVASLPDTVFDEYDMDKAHCSVWSKGQFGCFATEKQIVKKFYENGINGNLTIFLDDAVPHRNWQERLVKAYNQLPPDWDVLVLGTRLAKETKRLFRPIIHFRRKIASFFSSQTYYYTSSYSSRLDVRNGGINGLFATVYSPNGIKKLVAEPEQMRKDQDDILLSRLIQSGYLNVYIAYPMVVKEGVYDGSWTQKNDF
jgi:hypothetical protein